jgi:uncharacterized tellurite resistance protein B-like protein
MFEAFKELVAGLTSGDKHPSSFDENDSRLAAAALLVHAAAIDGDISEDERTLLHSLLKQRFDLDDAGTVKLLDAAIAAEHEAIDLYHFTSVLNRSLDDAGRKRLIEMLWQIALADGRVTEFEDNLIWRAADLLFISSRDRITLRQLAAERAKPCA